MMPARSSGAVGRATCSANGSCAHRRGGGAERAGEAGGCAQHQRCRVRPAPQQRRQGGSPSELRARRVVMLSVAAGRELKLVQELCRLLRSRASKERERRHLLSKAESSAARLAAA